MDTSLGLISPGVESPDVDASYQPVAIHIHSRQTRRSLQEQHSSHPRTTAADRRSTFNSDFSLPPVPRWDVDPRPRSMVASESIAALPVVGHASEASNLQHRTFSRPQPPVANTFPKSATSFHANTSDISTFSDLFIERREVHVRDSLDPISFSTGVDDDELDFEVLNDPPPPYR